MMPLQKWLAAWHDRAVNEPLHQLLRRWRWLVPLVVLILAAVHQAGLNILLAAMPAAWHGVTAILVYSLTGSVVAWLGLSWLSANAARRWETENRLRAAFADLEANHQRLLLLHELGEQVSNANDEQAILELAAQAPLRLAGAKASSVVTFNEDGNRLKLDMAWGLSESYLRAFRQRMDAGIDAERCRECTTLKTSVNSDCPLFVDLQPLAHSEGIGSLICLPISREQERVGIIAAYYPSANGPPEDQVRLLNILGGAIAAMLESIRVRARQVGTLYELDRASRSTDTLGEFTAQVLDIMVAGWDAQSGGLFLYDAGTQAWSCRAGHGMGEELADPRHRLALEYAQRAHLLGRAVIVPDLGASAEHGLQAVAAAPLISEGETLGAIFLGAKRRRALNERHSELLETMAHQTALAIRNAKLYDQLHQMAILEERYRLSREIHDGLAQTLGYLNFQVERLESLLLAGRTATAVTELNELRQSVRAAYSDVREAIDGLRLGVENPENLGQRLAAYLKEYTLQTGLPARLETDSPDLHCEPSTGLQLLRIVQEALTNVRKHAQARQVVVTLYRQAGELELAIVDDGRGFPADSPLDRPHRSYGLATMRERAQSLGGNLSVATGPGQGTRIVVNIPAGEAQ